MKKTLFWMMPVFLSVVPIKAADDLNAGVWESKITAVRMVETADGQSKMMATVHDETGMSLLFDVDKVGGFAPYAQGWKCDDDAKEDFKEGKVFMTLPSGEYLSCDYTKTTPYTVVSEELSYHFKGNSVLEADLPLGEVVDVYRQVTYRRQNGLTLGPVLEKPYQIVTEAVLKGKVVVKDDLFKFEDGTILDVYKHCVGIAVDPIKHSIVYRLSVDKKTIENKFVQCVTGDRFVRAHYNSSIYSHTVRVFKQTDIITKIWKKMFNGDSKVLFEQSKPETLEFTKEENGSFEQPNGKQVCGHPTTLPKGYTLKETKK